MEFLYQIENDGKAELIPQSESEFTEHEIENLLQENPALITGKPLLFIGRQVITSSSKRMDLLGVDVDARLVVIELKRGVAPRDIIAQVLDYSSWLSQLSEREIEKIAKDYFQKTGAPYKSLNEAYRVFSGKELNKQIGGEIVSVLFAREFTEGVTQPVNYLNENGLPIVCVQFEMYKRSDNVRFFYTRVISGEIDLFDEGNDSKTVSEKAAIKQNLRKMAEYLEDKYGAWSSSFSSEKDHPFKVYQNSDGTWSSVYIDWVLEDGARLALDFGIDMDEDNPKFCTYVHTRRKSKYFTDLIENRKNVASYFSDFEDESETEGRPELAKYSEIDNSSFDTIKEHIENEMIVLMPVIDEILGGAQ